MRLRRALVAVAVATTLTGLAGCRSGEPESTDQTGGVAEESTTAPTSGAGVAPVSTDTFVEQTVPFDLSDTQTVTVGVQSLVVEGETMTLTLVYTPNLTTDEPDDQFDLYDLLAPDGALRPRLLDRTNLKEYSVIDDAGTYWTTDVFDVDATNGKPVVFWAVYAAPQDNIDVMDIRVSSAWPEFTGVPIAR